MLHRKVNLSGINTFNLPSLSNRYIKELFQRLQNGEEEAREELIEGNLRLVLSILQRFKNRGESMDDLFQVGCIGLMKAIDNFKTDQKVNFSTYAVPMIVGEIKRHLRDNNNIHISRSIKNMAQRIQQTREKLMKEKLEEPTLKEIARELEISEEEAVFALNSSNDPISLYDPVFSDTTDPVYVMDMISDKEQTTDNWLETLAIKEALDYLGPREKEILKARFFQGKTQLEISKEIGISQAQVSRLEKAALKLIKNHYYKGESRDVHKTETSEPEFSETQL